ncbi:MAG: glycosyltransferase family 2 protein [Planctomycetaceae bacterium]|jgi:glycosyltransferase involved in cell wall biosynthesis|nr:glycosyltransferase family 2 protein [Planctomycetaceae bacterium]
MPTLSILIPVYDEAALLEQIVDRVISARLPEGFDREIIIVDDASTDSTHEIIRQLCKKYHDVITSFRQTQNKGKGAAIRLAINAAKGDYIIFQDADLEYNPDDYCDLLVPLLEDKADVVYGSRFHKLDCKSSTFVCHKFGNKLLTFITNLVTGLKLTDMETCYKIFRSDVIKSISLKSNRFEIEAEITIKIAKRNLRICEIPINYNGRDFATGKKITWKDGLIAIWTIFKYKFFDRE